MQRIAVSASLPPCVAMVFSATLMGSFFTITSNHVLEGSLGSQSSFKKTQQSLHENLVNSFSREANGSSTLEHRI